MRASNQPRCHEVRHQRHLGLRSARSSVREFGGVYVPLHRVYNSVVYCYFYRLNERLDQRNRSLGLAKVWVFVWLVQQRYPDP